MIKSVEKAKVTEWRNVWQKCDYATYFHSPQWYEIWEAYYDSRIQSYPLRVEFDDKKVAIICKCNQKLYKGFSKRILSSPVGTYGGWISRNQLSLLQTKELSQYIQKTFPNLIWRTNPYDANIRKLKFASAKNDPTQTLKTIDGYQTVSDNYSKDQRYEIRRAKREGVQVREAQSERDWDSYYAIYEDSLRRWGDTATTSYDKRIFKYLSQRPSTEVKLWLAELDDIPVAGALCLYSQYHVAYWHGAALEEYLNRRSVYGLLDYIIQDTCRKGFHWFDFNPSGDLKGVSYFKKNFGTIDLPSYVIQQDSVLVKNFTKVIQILKRS